MNKIVRTLFFIVLVPAAAFLCSCDPAAARQSNPPLSPARVTPAPTQTEKVGPVPSAVPSSVPATTPSSAPAPESKKTGEYDEIASLTIKHTVPGKPHELYRFDLLTSSLYADTENNPRYQVTYSDDQGHSRYEMDYIQDEVLGLLKKHRTLGWDSASGSDSDAWEITYFFLDGGVRADVFSGVYPDGWDDFIARLRAHVINPALDVRFIRKGDIAQSWPLLILEEDWEAADGLEKMEMSFDLFSTLVLNRNRATVSCFQTGTGKYSIEGETLTGVFLDYSTREAEDAETVVFELTGTDENAQITMADGRTFTARLHPLHRWANTYLRRLDREHTDYNYADADRVTIDEIVRWKDFLSSLSREERQEQFGRGGLSPRVADAFPAYYYDDHSSGGNNQDYIRLEEFKPLGPGPFISPAATVYSNVYHNSFSVDFSDEIQPGSDIVRDLAAMAVMMTDAELTKEEAEAAADTLCGSFSGETGFSEIMVHNGYRLRLRPGYEGDLVLTADYALEWFYNGETGFSPSEHEPIGSRPFASLTQGECYYVRGRVVPENKTDGRYFLYTLYAENGEAYPLLYGRSYTLSEDTGYGFYCRMHQSESGAPALVTQCFTAE